MTELPEEETPREVKPWDLLNPNNYDKDQAEVDRRMSICEQCPRLLYPAKICSHCRCFMTFKTKLEHAHCPERKW